MSPFPSARSIAPSSLWKHQWGETEYGIGILPLGGYVKMLGQDDDPRNAAVENERITLFTRKERPPKDSFTGQTVEKPKVGTRSAAASPGQTGLAADDHSSRLASS